MITVILRIFPLNKRASFSSLEYMIKEGSTLKDLLVKHNELSFSSHKFSIGINFISEDYILKHNDNINVFPF